MNKFEDLEVFKSAVNLMVKLYRLTDTFPSSERYGLIAQVRRASVSVVSNLAEGQGRLSYGEWRQMLSHARGSVFEIEAQLIASFHLGFMSAEQYDALRQDTYGVGALLMGLIRYVKKREASSRQKSSRHSPPVTRNP
jgi:four helix bundle protein